MRGGRTEQTPPPAVSIRLADKIIASTIHPLAALRAPVHGHTCSLAMITQTPYPRIARSNSTRLVASTPIDTQGGSSRAALVPENRRAVGMSAAS